MIVERKRFVERFAPLLAAAVLSTAMPGSNTALAKQDVSEEAEAARQKKDAEANQRTIEAEAKAQELIAQHEFEAAVGVLEGALREDDAPKHRAYLLLSVARARYAQGSLGRALESLGAAEPLLSKSLSGRRSTCYLYSLRSQVYLELGLIDIAYDWAIRAKEEIAALDRICAKQGKAFPFDAERKDAVRAEARVLLAMEDRNALDTCVSAALEQELHTQDPFQRAMLLSYRGTGKATARLNPSGAEGARADLEAALAAESLPDFERVLLEVLLAELALRASDWTTAERWLDKAARNIGPLELRAASLAHAAWITLTARLTYERQDREPVDGELAAIRDRLEDSLRERLGTWRQSELRPGGYGFLQYFENQSLLSELIRLEMKLAPEVPDAPGATGSSGVERALSHVLAAGEVATLARRLRAPPADIASVRRMLAGGGHACLLYFPGPDRSHLFLVEGEKIEHFALAASDFIERARAAVAGKLRLPLLANDPSSKARERDDAIAELTRVLLPAEVQERIKGIPRLSIVGRDLLGEVPFEAMRLESGELLGSAKAIGHLPSLAVGLSLAERARREAREPAAKIDHAAVLLAVPEGSGLSVPDERIDEILAIYPPQSRDVFRAGAATLENMRATLPRVRMAQIFTHGARDNARERPTGFLLAPDAGGNSGETSPEKPGEKPAEKARFVGADEVETLDAPPLVLLTVCGAGLGPKRRGDPSAADLAGAFLLAGSRARCVIQSSYDLDVEAARRLSVEVHRALFRGDDPAEALRKARSSLARDERFADPFYHALISVVGLGHEPIFAP